MWTEEQFEDKLIMMRDALIEFENQTIKKIKVQSEKIEKNDEEVLERAMTEIFDNHGEDESLAGLEELNFDDVFATSSTKELPDIQSPNQLSSIDFFSNERNDSKQHKIQVNHPVAKNSEKIEEDLFRIPN